MVEPGTRVAWVIGPGTRVGETDVGVTDMGGRAWY